MNIDNGDQIIAYMNYQSTENDNQSISSHSPGIQTNPIYCRSAKDQFIDYQPMDIKDMNSQFMEMYKDIDNAGTLLFDPEVPTDNSISYCTFTSPDELIYNHLQLTLQAQTEINGSLPLLEEIPYYHSLPQQENETPAYPYTLLDEFNYDNTTFSTPEYHPLSYFNSDLYVNTFEDYYTEQILPDPIDSSGSYFDTPLSFIVPSGTLTPPLLSATLSSSSEEEEEEDGEYDDNDNDDDIVPLACNHCHHSHVKCDDSRPCSRCTLLQKPGCHDISHKRRGRPRKLSF